MNRNVLVSNQESHALNSLGRLGSVRMSCLRHSSQGRDATIRHRGEAVVARDVGALCAFAVGWAFDARRIAPAHAPITIAPAATVSFAFCMRENANAVRESCAQVGGLILQRRLTHVRTRLWVGTAIRCGARTNKDIGPNNNKPKSDAWLELPDLIRGNRSRNAYRANGNEQEAEKHVFDISSRVSHDVGSNVHPRRSKQGQDVYRAR